MSRVITYELGDALYVNLTNRCTNSCDFCVRNNPDGIKEGLDLWLDEEPSIQDVVLDIQKRDLTQYKEIVFCGYGEPMMRTDEIVEIAKHIKNSSTLPIRVNTNGQANMYYKKDITPKLKGAVDIISISLNAKDAESYNNVCHSDYAIKAFDGLIDFAKKCKELVPIVIFSVVDVMPKDEIDECRKIADDIGVELRIRKMIL